VRPLTSQPLPLLSILQDQPLWACRCPARHLARARLAIYADSAGRYAAVSHDVRTARTTGKYFSPIAREVLPSMHARNTSLQEWLWKMSEDFITAH